MEICDWREGSDEKGYGCSRADYSHLTDGMGTALRIVIADLKLACLDLGEM